jgi:hypothetical protein
MTAKIFCRHSTYVIHIALINLAHLSLQIFKLEFQRHRTQIMIRLEIRLSWQRCYGFRHLGPVYRSEIKLIVIKCKNN